jgi:hypothetical protein
MYVYTPSTNTWVRRAALPATLWRNTVHQGAINGLLYVYGLTVNTDGTIGPQKFLRYSPATNTWTTLTLPSYKRWGGVDAVISGKFYLLGGRLVSSTGRVSGTPFDAHIYTPGAGWIKRPLGQGTGWGDTDLAYATISGRLFVAGSAVYTGDGCQANTSGVYDPASNTITRLTYTPPMRGQALGVAVSGRFLLMGGREVLPDPYGGFEETCFINYGQEDPFLTTSVLSYTPMLALR